MASNGTLYLCATPIGNLDDITLRVLETLKTVDLIAAEDTRNTMKLLNHFDIHTPMTSYHEHNKYDKAEELIRAHLSRGESVACVTDAGTPAISDPGEVLARRCLEEGIRVTSLPGACALIVALTMSGMPARRFCFEGFLPPRENRKERTHVLVRLRAEERTTIFYEAPHKLRATLEELYQTVGDRKLVICRELTKKYEEAVPTTLGEAVERCRDTAPRGEYVLVLAGADPAALAARQQAAWEQLSAAEHVALYEKKGMTRKEAMKQAALDRGVPKREIYRALLQQDEQDGSRQTGC